MHKQTNIRQYDLRLVALFVGFIIAFVSGLAAMFAAPAFADTASGDAAGDQPFVGAEYNRLLDADASKVSGAPVEYDIAESWVYGTDPKVPMPRMMYDDAVGEVSGELSITLIYNGETDEVIVTGLTQSKDLTTNVLYNGYINKYMPAGDYTLVFAVPSVIVGGSDKTFTQWWSGDSETATAETVYEANTYTFEFTVQKADIPEKYKTDIDSLIQAQFDYVYDGDFHFYASDNEFDIVTSGADIYNRGKFEDGEEIGGVYWLSEQADKYFGGMKVTFNLYRMQNNHYHTVDYLTGEADFTDCVAFAPREPGKYTVYYQISGDNYKDLVDVNSDMRREYVFYVTIVGVVNVPVMSDVIYNGTAQKGYISENQYYTVDEYNGWTNVGSYRVTLRLIDPECYMWNGQTLDSKTETYRIQFNIVKASNDWVHIPDVVRWVEGAYDPDENIIIGDAVYGEATFVITDADGNIVYSNVGDGVNKLASLKAGNYNFTATVDGNDNYGGLSYSVFVKVLKKQGLPWWGTLAITVGALLLVALVILILYKKGVFRFLTDKIVLSIRTKATVDATIAAVRANKVAAAAKVSVDQAEAEDRAAERSEQRKAAAEAERNKSVEEKMAALEAKAQVAAQRAERMREKAEAMQARLEAMRQSAANPTDTQSE